MTLDQWIRWFETALIPTEDGMPSEVLKALVVNHTAALTKGDAVTYSGKTDQQIIEIVHGRILTQWRQPGVEEKKFSLMDIIALIEQAPYVLGALAHHGDANKVMADAATEGTFPDSFSSHQMAAAAEIFGLAEIAEAVKAAPESDSGSGSSITMVAALTLLIALARRQAS